MVRRRTILKSSIAFGTLGFAGAVTGRTPSLTEATAAADDQLPSTITADTTLEELCPEYNDPYYVPRDFLDYLPTEYTSDSEKATQFEYNAEAVQNTVEDGTLTLGDLGTQALPIVQTLEEEGFPAHAAAKLLPRLALVPDETETLTLHNEPQSVWEETAGPTDATNDPPQFTQDQWPTDARTYIPEEVAERDRVHDQPQNEEWGSAAPLPEDVLNNDTNPVLDAASEKMHPVTGDALGDGFTATAPMAAEVKMHILSDGYWYQYLAFENTSSVPYHLDGAVLWWLGPSGMGENLADGHYNNVQRPNPSLGHPQRDVIEVVHDDYEGLSVYAVRLAFHDQPYHMRTAYPNQRWSLEIGTPNTTDVSYPSSEERQQLVDTMLNSLHVELETNMDRNDDLINEIDLKYRVPN